jgi:hypothetical protein
VRVERQRWKAEMAGEMAMGRAVCREEKNSLGAAAAGCERDRFKVSLSLFLFVKIPPPHLKIQYSMVFIGRVLLGFQISPSTFPFLLFSSFFL